jgi:cytochrome c
MKRGNHLPAAMVFLLAGIAPAAADGDAVAGAEAAASCAVCHNMDSVENKVGPGLKGIIGRVAGTQPDFLDTYSDAMKAAGKGGLIWNEETLAKFIKLPRAMVPGTSMTFAGVRSDQKIADIVAYIKSNPKP